MHFDFRSPLRLVGAILIMLAAAGALEAQSATITAGSASGTPGSMVTIDVTVEATEPWNGWGFNVTWDPAVIDLLPPPTAATIPGASNSAGALDPMCNTCAPWGASS